MSESLNAVSVEGLMAAGLIGLSQQHVEMLKSSPIAAGYLQWFVASGGKFEVKSAGGSVFRADAEGLSAGQIEIDFTGYADVSSQVSLILHELGHAAFHGVESQSMPTMLTFSYTTWCLAREANAAIFSYEAVKEMRAAGFGGVTVVGPGGQDWFATFKLDDDLFALRALGGFGDAGFSSKYTNAALELIGKLDLTQGGLNYAGQCTQPEFAPDPTAYAPAAPAMASILSSDADLVTLLDRYFARGQDQGFASSASVFSDWEGQAPAGGGAAAAEAYRIMQRIIDSYVPMNGA